MIGVLIFVLAIVCAFIASCVEDDIFSDIFLSLHSSSLFSFLKKIEKKREKGEEMTFEQISFLKKKIRKKKWRELFEDCLAKCRDTPPYKIFAGRKELKNSFQKLWNLSSSPSFFEEKERKWIREVEDNVRKREKTLDILFIQNS